MDSDLPTPDPASPATRVLLVSYYFPPSGGPGAVLCRSSVSADQATFGYPNVGSVAIPGPCCVDGPFFMGLEYTDQGIKQADTIMAFFPFDLEEPPDLGPGS